MNISTKKTFQILVAQAVVVGVTMGLVNAFSLYEKLRVENHLVMFWIIFVVAAIVWILLTLKIKENTTNKYLLAYYLSTGVFVVCLGWAIVILGIFK